MLATVRIFVSRFLARYTDGERIDDVLVAVSEACAGMQGGGLTVSMEVGGPRCIVTCEGIARPGEGQEDAMRERLLEALTVDTEWFRDDAVRFSMPLSD